MPYAPGPATAAQIARNGHIAALLRSYLTKRGWSPVDLNKHLGWARTNTSIYIWLAAKGGPGPGSRNALAKLFRVPEDELAPRKDAAVQHKVVKTSQSAVSFDALDARVRGIKKIWGRHYPESDPKPGPESVSRETDPLVVRITPSGDMHIRFDVTLPLEPGSVLLRMLLDMNIAVKSEAPR